MSIQDRENMEFSTPKRDSKVYNSIQLVTTSPPIKEDNLYPWNWSDNMVKIELQSPSSTSVTENAEVRSEGKRGRPRADVINALIHEGAQSPSNIKCNICNRVFPREKSLQAHRRTHTGDRPYQCDYPGCTKAFTQSGQLKTHQRLHTGEKPFICSAPGCKSRFTHANRHCTEHPYGKLRRVGESELNPQLSPAECNDEVLRWLEKYQNEKADRTPAKTRKTKRDDEEEGTPSTPNDLYSPSSGSDIMSPPPIKRNKSRRGLGPLMDQHLMREQSVIFQNVNRSNEENYPLPHYNIDENSYNNSVYVNSRMVPASPLRVRVLNSENVPTPIKSPYRDFDIDGIKPLTENEDEHNPRLRREFSSSTPLATSSPVALIKQETITNESPSQLHYSVGVPTQRFWMQPSKHFLEDDQYFAASEDLPDSSSYNKDILSRLLTSNSSPIAKPMYASSPSTAFSSEIFSTPVRQPIYYQDENAKSENIPNETKPSKDPETWRMKFYQDENIKSENIPTETKASKDSETWRMTLPKKKWMRDHYSSENINRQSVVVRSPLSDLCQNKRIESQKVMMGAVALIELGNVQEDNSQPLNLSTSKYSDT